MVTTTVQKGVLAEYVDSCCSWKGGGGKAFEEGKHTGDAFRGREVERGLANSFRDASLVAMPEKTRKFRKKTAPIGEILQLGHVRDGELLRYKNKSKDLLMVGRARSDGIECYERPGVSYTQFEQMAGSKLHRPCEHIMAINGKTLQQIIGEIRAQQLHFDIPDARKEYELVAKLDPTTLWRKNNVARTPGALKKLCSVCGTTANAQEGGLILCRRCPAAYHPSCASSLSVLPSPEWACPACSCSICFGSHFASHTHLRLPACFIDTVPTGRPKNTCTIELPTEGYVSLEWVQAVMETRTLVTDILMEEARKCETNSYGAASNAAATGNLDSNQAVLADLLGLVRGCSELEQIQLKLNEKFPEEQGSATINQSILDLFGYLFPGEEFKDREQLLTMVAKHLLDVIASNGPNAKTNNLKGPANIKSSPPAWQGIPLKRRKIQQDLMKPTIQSLDQAPLEGLPNATSGGPPAPQMPNGFSARYPMQWYQMNRGTGFRGPFPQGHFPMGPSEVRNAIEQMTRHMMGAMGAMGRYAMLPGMGGSFSQENGLPGWFNRKWRPRGSPANGAKDPRFCSIQKPLLIPENLEEGQKEAEEKELNLFVTGTNGTATCEAIQSKIDANFDAVVELMDPEILRQAGVDVDKMNAEAGSKVMQVDDKEDVPRFDLGGYLAECEAQSDHVMSSESESSIDVEMGDAMEELGSQNTVAHHSNDMGAHSGEQHKSNGVLTSNRSEEMPAPTVTVAIETRSGGEPCSQRDGGGDNCPVGGLMAECRGENGQNHDCMEIRVGSEGEIRRPSHGTAEADVVDGVDDVVVSGGCNESGGDEQGRSVGGSGADMEVDDVNSVCSDAENVEAECNGASAGQTSTPPGNHNDPSDMCDIPLGDIPETTGKVPEKSRARSLSERCKSGKGLRSNCQTGCNSPPGAPSDSATVTDNGLGVACGDDCEETQPARGLQGFDQTLEVCCAQCNRRCHLGCLSPDQIRSWAPWFCCQGCHDVSWSLAELNCRGLIQIDRLVDNTPVSWQLIRGAAVMDSTTCQGYAPRYKTSQKKQLKQVLNVVCDVMQASQVLDNDLLTSLIHGQASSDTRRDFSNFQTAILWVGATLVGACQLRVLGLSVAEIVYIEIRPEFQRSGLGKHLLGSLEKRLLELGVERLVMPSIKNIDHMSGSKKTDSWPAAMGYTESSVSEFAEFNTFGLVHIPGFPFAMKTCKAENIVQFEMYCKRPPVRRERLLQAMVEHKRSKPRKNATGDDTEKANPSQDEPSKHSEQAKKSDTSRMGTTRTSKASKGEDSITVVPRTECSQQVVVGNQMHYPTVAGDTIQGTETKNDSNDQKER